MTIPSLTQAAKTSEAELVQPAAARRPAASQAKAEALFSASLDTASKSEPAGAGEAGRVSAAAGASISNVYRGSKSGVLSPVQQFESFVLRSFVETMLPQENTAFFGTGTAGQIWKSMLAERIGDEMARDGGIGIAEMIGKRGASGDALKGAEATLAPTDTLSLGAKTLKGAGSL